MTDYISHWAEDGGPAAEAAAELASAAFTTENAKNLVERAQREDLEDLLFDAKDLRQFVSKTCHGGGWRGSIITAKFTKELTELDKLAEIIERHGFTASTPHERPGP